MGSMSNGDLCDGSLNTRPLEYGYCTSFGVLLKFKKPKVSAVREFPPGCGPNALRLHEVEAQAMVKSEGAPERDIASEIGSMVEGMIPPVASKAWSPSQWPLSDATNLKDTALKNVYHGRRSAKRGFPPFCGRNPPQVTEEERMIIVLGKWSLGAPVEASVTGGQLTERVRGKEGCSVRESACSLIEELDGGVQDGNALKKELKGLVPEPKNKSRKVLQGMPLKETGRAEVGGAPLRVIARTGDGNVRDGNAQKRKLEGSVLEPKTKFQKVTQAGFKTSVGVALGRGVETVIVQGLMAATNHSERCGNEGGHVVSSQNGMTAGSEGKRHEVSLVKGHSLSTSFRRVNNVAGDHLGRNSMKKKLLPSKKASCASLGEFDVDVNLPPFGPCSSSHGNVGNKARETLRLFQVICRKLLRGEESMWSKQGYQRRRIDLLADKIVRARGIEIGKRLIGSVPGVEVNDQFQYRVELALVGIHRPYQGGIDFMKHDGMSIATSIVSSGSYADDLENPDILIYSGQGGNIVGKDKRPKDQKLETGNLALKNSISVKNPVRVVHGFKETKGSGSDAKAKIVLTYNYDGLYTVERYWHEVGPHGKLVYMFELKRMPGQPEVSWKVANKSNKYKVREGLSVGDISGGKERFPICAVNTESKEKPPKFDYITLMKYPDWYLSTPPKGCDCTDGCLVSKKCSCVVKNGGELPYNYSGAIVEAKTLVYECGPACKCPPSCYNRVSQLGIQIQLEIFKTKLRGWGVRSLTAIPSGSFICEYIGELLEDKEAEQRQNDEYLFDIGQNYSDCSLIGLSSGVVEDSCFTIDAANRGNVGRFINHSCSPNLYAQNVLYDHEDKRMPHIMLFAAENIPPLKELTYHYNYKVDQIRDSNGEIRTKRCYCGSAECTGRLY
ncbi:hypothetical protein Vadar_024328 [Vaccinium darrowii]|uniref:Uncharacterized protein n=1 Tax=Vaccinium darrowii TaxID=229202 RepID=A0ACB7X427_9ERIC|nr:hypothetical protein Vadar_024328 [Vaccinium darrowii]